MVVAGGVAVMQWLPNPDCNHGLTKRVTSRGHHDEAV